MTSILSRAAATALSALILWTGPIFADNEESKSASVEEMGYTISLHHRGSGSLLSVKLDGEEVYRMRAGRISYDPPSDLTGNGTPNLLVHASVRRSTMSVALLELDPAGVTEIWEVSGHVSKMNDVWERIRQKAEAGESLEQRPGTESQAQQEVQVPEEALLEEAGDSDESIGTDDDESAKEPCPDDPAVLGYEIVRGPGQGEIVLLQHGDKAWSLNTYMASVDSVRRQSDGSFKMVISTRETRQRGSVYTLELGPDGVKELSVVAGPPSGIQPPRQDPPVFK